MHNLSLVSNEDPVRDIHVCYSIAAFFTYVHERAFHLFCLFVCFVALRPKSTAMVIAGRSVHLTTLFPGQA